MSLTAPNPIVKPFCNSGTQVAPPVGEDTFVANQETGFPDSQATPLPAGTEVQQNQMNGVLKLYTSLLLWLNSGGQFTFNQAFSDANNGYALDNILWCASNSTFQRSLVANNTANFVTTPSYINDGINWIDVNNTSFPDFQNNPTTGDVTIGGRVVNSVNNIKTLGDDGKLSGLLTDIEGSLLYVTEPDGHTINTAVVNPYGYRPYHDGTATAIFDPANTFAYVSELPVVPAAPKYRVFSDTDTSLQIHAVYDPITMLWLCSCSGYTSATLTNQVLLNKQLNLSSIVTGTTQNNGAASYYYSGSATDPGPSTFTSCIMLDASFLELQLTLISPFTGNLFLSFSLVFTATEII